jgi:hypothetical protein
MTYDVSWLPYLRYTLPEVRRLLRGCIRSGNNMGA